MANCTSVNRDRALKFFDFRPERKLSRAQNFVDLRASACSESAMLFGQVKKRNPHRRRIAVWFFHSSVCTQR